MLMSACQAGALHSITLCNIDLFSVGTSSVISESQEESRQMGSAILQSKKLLTKYGRREMTDKVLIFLALLFFFACVLYVLKRRLF